MMTNAAAVLPNMTPPAKSQTPDAPAAKKTGTKPSNSTVSNSNSNTCEQTAERPATFEEALKKRLKKTATTDNTAVISPENADTPQPVALELAAIFNTRHKAPIPIKLAADQDPKEPKKQAQKPIFRTENAVFETPLTAKTTHAAAPATAVKTDSKPIAQCTEQPPAPHTKSSAENVAKTPKNPIINTEKPSEPIAAQDKLTADKGPLELTNEAKTLIHKSQPLTKTDLTIDSTPKTINSNPLAPRNNTAAPTPPTENESVSSLKKSVFNGVKADSGDESTPEQTSADPKLTHLFDSKEKTPSAHTVTTSSALDSAAVSAPSTASSTSLQVDSIKAVTDTSTSRPIDQIVQTLQLRTFGADSQVRMMLAPEELGAIRITFRQINNEVVGLLEVQKTETRKEIAQSISQLTAAMETAGVQIRRIEVLPWTANSQTPRGEQFSQDFDAASHQEMYRSAGESKTQNDSNKRLTDDSDNLTTPSLQRENRDFGAVETGLNFFL